MKNLFSQIVLAGSKINRTHLQYALMLLALAMLVLGAGAPESVGGSGR
jgi:hypothetical protein